MLPRHLSPRFAWRLLSRWTGPNLAEFHAGRQPTVWLLALFAGLGTAVAAILFRLGIGFVQLPWLGTTAERVASASQAVPWWAILAAPTLGGLIVGVMVDRLLPTRRTGAVADVIEARVQAGRPLGFWPGIWSAIITVLSLGSGASAGREGPIVHLGATIGTALCGRFHLPGAARRTLLACGAAGRSRRPSTRPLRACSSPMR